MWQIQEENRCSLFFGEEPFEGEDPIEEKKNGNQSFGEGVFADRLGKQEKPHPAENRAQKKKTDAFQKRHPIRSAYIFPLLFELPAPA